MKRFRLSLPIVAALVGAAMLGAPNQAQATFQIRASIDGGATFLTRTDEVVGEDNLTGVPGFINASFSFANVTIFVTAGQSKPVTGSPGQSLIDIGINGTFTSAALGGLGGSVIVDISDQGFSPPGSPAGPGLLTASLGGLSLAGLTGVGFTGYANGGAPGGNILYGGIDAATGNVFATATATVGSPVQSVDIPSPNLIAPYSMSARTTFTGAAGVTFSIDNNVTFANPAPAGLVLAFSGLPMLGLRAWIRRRRVPTAA